MTLNHIDINDLEFTECIDEIEVLLPGGHAYTIGTQQEIFINDTIAAIGDEYQTHHTKDTIYLKSFEDVYSGNLEELAALMINHRCLFAAVNDDDKPGIIKEHFL